MLSTMAPNESFAHSSSYYKIKTITIDSSDNNSSCTSWLSYLRGDFTLSSIPYKPMRIAVSNYFLSTQTRIVLTCSVPSVVQEMVSFLLPGSTSSTVKTTLQRYCNGYNWTVYSCSGASSLPSICVGCSKDPCVDRAIIVPLFKVNPCESYSNRASIIAMRVDYSYRQPPPTILELSATATNTTVLITGTLSFSGGMYCGVFSNDDLIYTLNPSSLSERIIFQNNFASSNSQNIVRIIVSGLKALTTYKIFCMTKLFGGATMSIGNALSKSSTTFTTACCKLISVKQSVTVNRYGENLLSFLRFSIDSLPSSSVVLSANIRTPNASAVVTVVKGSFFPSQLVLDSSYSIGSSGNILLTMSLTNGLPLGCYVYSITLGGPSASEYEIIYNSPFTKFCVVAENYIPAAPTLVSAGWHIHTDPVRFAD